MTAPVILVIPLIFLFTGCATTSGGGGGWVVIDKPAETSPQPQPAPPGNARGQEIAARNHIRSAYKFLQKDKPDHALRELEKARAKMGHDYWFNYYMAGAYYMKSLYREADKSWEMAYRYTKDPLLRSRIMTCRSFTGYDAGGPERAMDFLGKAIDLDGKNGSARELLDDLESAPKDEQAWQPPGQKGKKTKTTKDKDGKNTGKGGKIKDKSTFMAYFLVEMPQEQSGDQP